MSADKDFRSLNALFDGALLPCVKMALIEAIGKNAKNARTHSPTQVRKIQASIRKFGFLNPILVDEKMMVLAGHGRLEAARREGLTHVPIICFTHLTEAQKRAYLIADNKIAEGAGWDREMLAIELGELVDLLPVEGLDISLTGFETAEVDLLLADMAANTQRLDDALPPIPANPITRRGELWLLEKQRLLCGDAQNGDAIARLMAGRTASAVITDAPFNRRVSAIGGRGKIKHPEFAFASGEMTPPQFRRFLSKTLGNGIAVSADGAVHYVFMDWRHIDDLLAVARKLYSVVLNIVVWNKTNAGQGSFYRSQHELIGVFRVGEQSHRNNVELGRFGRNRSNLWTCAGVNSFGRGRMDALAAHPTVKPTSLIADAILDCTARGDIVLDQFAGSGTIFLAAEKVGRTAYGMEYEPRYVDVAIQRWQSITKLEATLEGDGRTFAEIAEARANTKSGPPEQKPIPAAGIQAADALRPVATRKAGRHA
jgi:hypothetical protein